MDFLLSSKSLKNINESGVKKDFKIEIFGNTIECSLFVALFISKRISQYYRADPTIREFKLQFPTQSVFYSKEDELKQIIERTNFISIFQNFIEGSPIHFELPNNDQNEFIKDEISNNNVEKIKLIIEIGKILDNDEMIEFGLKKFGFLNKTKSMSLTHLIQFRKTLLELGYSYIVENIYDMISANFIDIFYEETKIDFLSELKKMDKNELDQIFGSKNLQIESEDWLFEIITNLGEDFYFLYDYIEMQYLSVDNIQKLINNIDQYEIPLHKPLWSSICRRLIIDVSTIIKSSNPRQKSFPFIDCKDGIFNYLQKEKNENVYTSKIIDVKISDKNGGDIKNLFDHSKTTFLKVTDQVNSYIIIDFKDKKVNLTKYYFSVPVEKSNWKEDRPKSWLIEVSNDREEWITVDSRMNDYSLAGFGKFNTFTISNKSKDFYRYVRIKEIIGQNGNHRLLLSEVEFYGKIIHQ